MKHTLVVNTTINRIPGTFTSIVRYILIQIVTGAGHHRKSITQTITVISATPKSKRHSYQTQSINLITGFHAAGLEVTMSFAITTIIQIRRAVGYIAYCTAGTTGIAARTIIVIVIVTGTHRQLTALNRTEQTTAGTHVTDVSAKRSRVTFQSATYGNDIQDTTHTLSIILRARISNHLDMLNGIGGHTFQHFRRIVTHHIVRFTVHIHLKAAAAVHLNIIFAVYGYQRHFAKHFQYRV